MTVMRRVGAIGDLHCQDVRLQSALERCREQSVDRIVQLGDITDGPGDLDRCIDLLKAHDVLAIAGNHDRWSLQGSMRDLPHATMQLSETTREYLASLPPSALMPTTAGGALLCHGVGEDDMAFLDADTRGYGLQSMMGELRPLMEDPAVQLMLGGHTHRRMVRAMPGFVVINAGTLADNGPPGFIIVNFDARLVELFDFVDDAIVEREPVAIPDPLGL